jgi:hypothetical protein
MKTLGLTFASLLVLGMASAGAGAQDLSKYRDVQLGSDLKTVAKQAGVDVAEIKLIHSHPALIQELHWRPEALGALAEMEPAKDVTLSLYNGDLFQIAVSYDRYSTEGMTSGDMVDAISIKYGVPAKSHQKIETPLEVYGTPDEPLAEWQDSQYRFTLIRRSTYGEAFILVGVSKKLEAAAKAAATAAIKIEAQEAPQKEVQRLAAEKQQEQLKLDQARLLNKTRFRL